jgi:hypothetical protein
MIRAAKRVSLCAFAFLLFLVLLVVAMAILRIMAGTTVGGIALIGWLDIIAVIVIGGDLISRLWTRVLQR